MKEIMKGVKIYKYKDNMVFYINFKDAIPPSTEMFSFLMNYLYGVVFYPNDFYKNSYGKTYVKKNPVYFNSSKSGKDMVIGVNFDREIGIDMEDKSRNVKKNVINSRFFTEGERGYVDDAKDKSRAILEIWTKKEAYIKSKGKGLSKCPLVDTTKEDIETFTLENKIVSIHINQNG